MALHALAANLAIKWHHLRWLAPPTWIFQFRNGHILCIKSITCIESITCITCINCITCITCISFTNKIRTHHDKVCSVWPLNLDWDVVAFLNFRSAIFLEIRFVFLLSMHFWFVANWFKIWPSGHVTCIAWFQSWSPGCVTRVATLPWNALLASSVSIEFVSSLARVTSVKSAQTSLT